MLTLDAFLKRLKNEPGVTYVGLVGSVLKSDNPHDLDVVVNVLGRDETEVFERYQDTPVLFRGRQLLVDLHLQSTDNPPTETLRRIYGDQFLIL